jgi:hypothetical protein
MNGMKNQMNRIPLLLQIFVLLVVVKMLTGEREGARVNLYGKGNDTIRESFGVRKKKNTSMFGSNYDRNVIESSRG